LAKGQEGAAGRIRHTAKVPDEALGQIRLSPSGFAGGGHPLRQAACAMHHIALRALPGGLPRRRANRAASSWSKYALMRTLFHFPLQPQSRRVRLQLREKKLDFEARIERPWERRAEFLHLDPAGETPVLVEEEGGVIAGALAIGEYLEEAYPGLPLLDAGLAERAEIRRLVAWFDLKFDREVTQTLLGERFLKRLSGQGEPDSGAIRAGRANIRQHLAYIAWLADQRNWLAGDAFSLADLAAAAHLSAIDYLGDVPWEEFPEAKNWYARVKSRPSFRPLLADHWPGTQPPAHYADLDF
jgi:glutathione S-transferase